MWIRPIELRRLRRSAAAATDRRPYPTQHLSARRDGRPDTRYVVSSGAIRPARAPPSIDMLQMVIRSSIERERMVEPQNSKTQPVPPPIPIREIRFKMMSFAPTPGFSWPSTRTSNVFDLRLQQTLGGKHVLHLAGSDAESKRAECAMSSGVAVAADHGHARLCQTQFRPDDVNNSLFSLFGPYSLMPKSRQFFSS